MNPKANYPSDRIIGFSFSSKRQQNYDFALIVGTSLCDVGLIIRMLYKRAKGTSLHLGSSATPFYSYAARLKTEIFSRREKSKLSRAVERSDTPGKQAKENVSLQGIINSAPR